MKARVNTILDYDLKQQARHKNIQMHEALQFGVLFKIAEKGDISHPKNTLLDKISKLALKLQDTLTELENARDKIKELERVTNDRACISV